MVDSHHVFGRAQFGVRHVEEPGTAHQSLQGQPILDMQGVVGLVSSMGLEVNRHGLIASNRQVVAELLEIGTMVLSVATREWHPFSRLRLVRPRELDGGGVAMDLGDINRERLNGRQREGGLQGRAIGLEQRVECPTQPIIGERWCPSLMGLEQLGPGRDAVERRWFDQHVCDEKLNRCGVPRRTQDVLKSLAHPERREAAIAERQGRDPDLPMLQIFGLHDDIS